MFFVLSFLFIGVRAQSTQNIIVFTFDGGAANVGSQLRAGDILKTFNKTGTFYYSLHKTGQDRLSDYHALREQGHDIGGHTLDYVDLTTLSYSDALSQICLNRRFLLDNKFKPKSFAYPYGKDNFDVSVAARTCGYNSGTTLVSINNYVNELSNVLTHTTFLIKTISLETKRSLSELQTLVTDGFRGTPTGTTLIIVFRLYEMCDGCATLVDYTTFNDFVDWLSTRGRTRIKNIDQVIEGDLAPLPIDYQDPGRLLPGTLSKLMVAMGTVGGMIVFMISFFTIVHIKDCVKERRVKREKERAKKSETKS